MAPPEILCLTNGMFAENCYIVADREAGEAVLIDPGEEAELFLARRDGAPAGRISAHVNRLHDEHHGPGTGFVGFFECEDSLETARALFEAAAL